MNFCKGSIAFLGILAVFLNASGQAWADGVDPYLEDISRDRSAVDTTSSSQTMTVELRAIDEYIDGLSGVDRGSVTWRSPSSGQIAGFGFYPEWNLASGDVYDGVYSFPVTFEMGSESGVWLPVVVIYDGNDNRAFYNNDDLIALGFDDLGVTVTTAVPDVTPPVLVDITRDTNAVNTDGSSQTVQVSVRATDDLSGVHRGSVTWRSPSGDQIAGFGFYPEYNLVSGDVNDGTYEFPVTFKQYCEPGTWLPVVGLEDEIGNDVLHTTADLATLGFTDLAIDVFSSTPDVTAPVLADLDREPERVITTNSDETIQVAVRVTDDLSGVYRGNLTWHSPSSGEIAGFGFYHKWNLASGDANDGIYEFPVTFPEGCEKGTWLPVMDLQDEIGNSVYYSNSDLAALGLNLAVEVGAVAGDANEDGYVNVVDLGILATHYGATSGAQWGDGDFNNDGEVNVSDLGDLASNYGTVPMVAVPEPSVLTCLLGLWLTGYLFFYFHFSRKRMYPDRMVCC